MPFPDHVVKGTGAAHLRRLEQVVSLGISAAGIQGPLVFPDLPTHPTGEVAADARFRMPVAGCSVGSVDSFSRLGGITGSFPLVALASRCASPQLIRNGGWGAADLSGDGTRAEALLLEDFDGSSVFHAKMLSLLAFCGFCDTMMAVHSDCPPSVEVVW